MLRGFQSVEQLEGWNIEKYIYMHIQHNTHTYIHTCGEILRIYTHIYFNIYYSIIHFNITRTLSFKYYGYFRVREKMKLRSSYSDNSLLRTEFKIRSIWITCPFLWSTVSHYSHYLNSFLESYNHVIWRGKKTLEKKMSISMRD